MWQSLVNDLVAAGLSESEIGRRVGYSQTTIHRLKHGRMAEPTFSRGRALLALHEQVCQRGESMAESSGSFEGADSPPPMAASGQR